ncbi:MAG: hypothetical protein EA384_11625 [Spirochaetaceae bacterium]|nr:MAG: hypothetical protein EA384_11625 [Spirochaetaceae bacterium]
MSRNIRILWMVFMVLPAASLLAQSADRVDAILAADPLSLGDAAYLAVMSAGRIDPEAGSGEAMAVLGSLAVRAEHRDRFSDRDLQADATLGDLAYMLMLAHDISGGFWYRRIPGPRYSVREMRFRRLVQGQSYALQPLSGERAMRVTGRVLAMTEQRR